MLTVHRAEGTAVLAAGLAELLADPLADPLASEVVAVPARGIERWLTQQLADRLGVCAAVEFLSPARLVATALAEAQGFSREDDPWARPLWPLLDVIDTCLDESWCAPLAAHLGGPGDELRRGRRYATAAHLAGLFASYGAHRPGMLRDWAAGRDTDGEGPLAADLAWQAELWRRLRAELGPSPAERLDEACATLRRRAEVSSYPVRISVFGATRMAADQLAVLSALAEHRDVHVWLPHPSPALWSALSAVGVRRRRDAPVDGGARHPLLRSLSRDVRELQLKLPAHAAVWHEASGPRPATLLGRLQADLRDDLAPSPAEADGTVVVHACHGAARQVEVLREVLLRLFVDDPTLEPRDVLVMCPDIETFAPLVSAAFGLAGVSDGLAHPGHQLRVRLADRALRQTNPLLDTVAVLLDLAGGRVTASQVLDLAASPGVRRAFGFDDEELERIRDWVGRSGVRWGLSAATRSPYSMQRFGQGTWEAGLDRVLLGVTTAEDEPVWLGLALPLDDVDSSDIDLAGRLAELVDRLGVVLAGLTGVRPVAEWTAALSEALELLTATSDGDAWQVAQAHRELAAAADGATTPVRLADVRALLRDRLRGRPTRSNFRTGNLTVATMVPMRSVPHRVVVLLGLDDGVFPRAGVVDGDDVLARDPWVGERDARSEDRQLLLDAVLAAGERLVLLHSGVDPVSGAARPPAVPVGELLDVLRVMAPPVPAGAPLVVAHPLQPWDARSFSGPRPFSFDPVALAGAHRAALPRVPEPEGSPLPALTGPVALEDLVAFVEHPVKAYLRQRLRITLPGEDDEVEDALPVELDGLGEWAVGERMLAAGLRGDDVEDTVKREWLRGTLPPGNLGSAALQRIRGRVGPLVETGRALVAEPARAVDIRLDLGGRVLSGTVNDVRGDATVRVTYSNLSPRHRVRAWVLALVLAACGEGRRAITLGRRGSSASTSTLTAPDDALAQLARLLVLFDAGMREPLPMAVKSSARYAAARRRGASVEDALDSAEDDWKSKRYDGEDADRHHRHVYGGVVPLSHLLVAPPAAGESFGGEHSRFGVLACGLWAPLLACERLT